MVDGADDRPLAYSQIGWHELENGALIQQAEEAGYEVLLSTDKNIRYQQNLSGRKIALVVLGNQQWPVVKLYLDRIAAGRGPPIWRRCINSG